MGWVYPGATVRRADGKSGLGTIRSLAEGPFGVQEAEVEWLTGGLSWMPLSVLTLVQEA